MTASSKTALSVGALPAGAWIVLGFLLDGSGPRAGYALQAQAARSVAQFWPVTKAHVYAALPRLEAAGLVTSELVEQTGAPDKRVYAATDAGRSGFTAWLGDADLGGATLRHPLLVKIFFGAALPPRLLAAMLAQQETRCREGIADYQRILARAAAERSKSASYRRLAIRHGILALEAELAWIAEVQRDAKR